MDFNVYAVNRIVEAINKVNTSIQKTKTYKDANTFYYDINIGNFGGASVVNSTGAAAALAFLGVITLVPGTTDAVSVATGDFNIATELQGSVNGVPTITGILDSQPGLGSSIIEISGIAAALAKIEVEFILQGSVAAISTASGTLDTELLAGETDGVGSANGNLEVATELIGSCTGTMSQGSAHLWT